MNKYQQHNLFVKQNKVPQLLISIALIENLLNSNNKLAEL